MVTETGDDVQGIVMTYNSRKASARSIWDIFGGGTGTTGSGKG